MKTYSFSSGTGSHKVEGQLTLCGNDICLNIGGGTLHHIGAVAVAEPRESLKGNGELSASCSTLCMLGHKDDMLARECALSLAAYTGCRTVVTVGLHVDKAEQQDIQMLTEKFWQLVDEYKQLLK